MEAPTEPKPTVADRQKVVPSLRPTLAVEARGEAAEALPEAVLVAAAGAVKEATEVMMALLGAAVGAEAAKKRVFMVVKAAETDTREAQATFVAGAQ